MSVYTLKQKKTLIFIHRKLQNFSQTPDIKHVIAINQSVYERASFGISVLSTTDEDWLEYINLGRKLQSLQMN